MSDTEAAIAAATHELDRALGISEAPSRAAGAGVHEPSPQREAPGELQQLGSGPPMTEERLRDITRQLEERSAVAAEAVALASADIRELRLDAKDSKVLRTIASLYVEDILMGRLEPRYGPSGRPCECDAALTFTEDDEDGDRVKVRCLECSAVWRLKRWLSETVKRVQASEAKRLGRPLTDWEAHSLDDQCYFRTLPNGAEGLPGDKGS